jgi:hypothetical protein
VARVPHPTPGPAAPVPRTRQQRAGAVAAVVASTVGALLAVGLAVTLGAPDVVVDRADAVAPPPADDAAPVAAPRLALVTRAWQDTDGDGLRTTDEPPLAGVVVQLETGDGEPARDGQGRRVPAATTGDDGTATFTALAEGVYRVRYVLPAGQVLTTPVSRPAHGDVDSDADPVDTTRTVGLSGPLPLTVDGLDRAPAGVDADRVLQGVDVGSRPAAELLDAIG